MSNLRFKISLIPIIAAIAVIFGLFLGKYIYTNDKIYTIDFVSGSSTHKLQRVLDAVKHHYVDSVDYANIEKEAISGVLKHLDPHSNYFSKEQMMIENDRIEGNFAGIGVKFKIIQDTIWILNIIPNGPAKASGLKPGDKIIEVNDTAFAGFTLDVNHVVTTLRGEVGESVEIKVLRGKEEKIFNIERGNIPLESVDFATVLKDKIGYVKINRFSKKTHEEFLEATEQIEEKDIDGMVIDLRGNPGGLMDQVIKLCDEFLTAKKIIVFTKDKYQREEFLATSKGRYKKVPLIVLIDEGSASASEIFAGAMQDNDRATIIGRRSYGKGLVQRPFDLRDGSVLRLTIAHYYTPVGRNIQRPYSGSKDEYYNEIQERLKNGEMFAIDSIKLDDSLKYITPEGNVVFGGGGIFPDIFVPVDSGLFSSQYVDIYQNALIERFSIAFKDSLLKDLEGKTIQHAYDSLVQIDLIAMFNNFLISQPSISALNLKINPSDIGLINKINREIKSNILEYRYGKKGSYYPLIVEDKVVKTALENLKSNFDIPPSQHLED